jgi:3D (Asp-Asp-Asp) domain-containing protein
MPLAAPSYQIAKRVRVRVTACSPEDPWDLAYYAANGYEGAIYGIAADPRVFPKGTILRVPGYREKHAPHAGGWTVDSKGGSVIRASSRRGIKHIDVKFRTLHSARAWGSRWLIVDVLTPTKAP